MPLEPSTCTTSRKVSRLAWHRRMLVKALLLTSRRCTRLRPMLLMRRSTGPTSACADGDSNAKACGSANTRP